MGRKPEPAKPKRYGIRTLAWLSLAAVSILISNNVESIRLLTFLGTVSGLIGAAVCSVRGLRSWSGLQSQRY